MGPENSGGQFVAYIDGQPVEIGKTLAEIDPDYSAGGVSAADAAEAMGNMAAAMAGVSMTIESSGGRQNQRRSAGTSLWPLSHTGGPAHGQINRPSAEWKGVAAMAACYPLPDRRDLAAFPALEKRCREFERAMDYVAQTAKLLDTDAEEMNREAATLAESTTMTQTDALYYVAERRRSDAIQKWGGGHG